jgi:hypothetical protein
MIRDVNSFFAKQKLRLSLASTGHISAPLRLGPSDLTGRCYCEKRMILQEFARSIQAHNVAANKASKPLGRGPILEPFENAHSWERLFQPPES